MRVSWYPPTTIDQLQGRAAAQKDELNMLIGAMDLPFVWQAWDRDRLQQHMDALAQAGINTFMVESEANIYSEALISSAHRAGLQFFGGLNCFFNPGALQQRPELYPIDQTGARYPVRSWYNAGIIPTDEMYNAELRSTVSEWVRTYPMDGILLNFIRWPLFWEYELRPDTPHPVQTSFDPQTLRRFQSTTGITLPASCPDPGQQAAWILAHHTQEWTDFKCDVITSLVRQLVDEIRAVKGAAFPIGLCPIPALPDVLEPILGQRLSDLAPLVDFVLPMTYHAIVHQPLAWISSILESMREHAPRKLVPFVLSTTEEGWAALPDDDWEAMVDLVLSDQDTQGLTFFMGTGLLTSGRSSRLKTLLAGCAG